MKREDQEQLILLASRVSRQPWSSGRVVHDLARGLCRRGCRVVLVAHSVDDPDEFQALGIEVVTQHVYVEHHSQFPLNFEEWAVEQTRRLAAHHAGSTRIVILTHRLQKQLGPEADRILNADLPAQQWLRHLHDTRGILGSMVGLVRHHGALICAAQALIGTASKTPTMQETIYAPLSAQEEPDWRSLRLRARNALGLDHNSFTVLISNVEPSPIGVDKGLSDLIRAAAQLNEHLAACSRKSNRRLVLLVLSHQPFRVEQHLQAAAQDPGSAQQRNMRPLVRVLGTTQRIDAALAACDLVAMLRRTSKTEGINRFAADALWAGKPVAGCASRHRGLDDLLDPSLLAQSDVKMDARWWRGILEPMLTSANWMDSVSADVRNLARQRLHIDRLIDSMLR